MIRTKIGKRLASLPPRAKLALMVCSDALLLPLCLLGSLALRMGSLESALETSPLAQLTLGLLSLPILAYAGLYRTVVRYIDIRVIARACLALAVVVLVMYSFALAF